MYTERTGPTVIGRRTYSYCVHQLDGRWYVGVYDGQKWTRWLTRREQELLGHTQVSAPSLLAINDAGWDTRHGAVSFARRLGYKPTGGING